MSRDANERIPLIAFDFPLVSQRKCSKKRYALLAIVCTSFIFFYVQNATINSNIESFVHMIEVKEDGNMTNDQDEHIKMQLKAVPAYASGQLFSNLPAFNITSLGDDLSEKQNGNKRANGIDRSISTLRPKEPSWHSINNNTNKSLRNDMVKVINTIKPTVPLTTPVAKEMNTDYSNITYRNDHLKETVLYITNTTNEQTNSSNPRISVGNLITKMAKTNADTTPVQLSESKVSSVGNITTKFTKTITDATPMQVSKKDVSLSGYKTILFYTAFFEGSWTKFLRNGRTDLAHHGCPVNKCFFTFDRSKVSSADALVFHAADFNLNDLPGVRHPRQRYIWMNAEAPCLNQRTNKEQYHGKPGFFNWTATYHRGSEILVAYGGLVPLEGVTMPSRLAPIDHNSTSYHKYIEALSKRMHSTNKNKVHGSKTNRTINKREDSVTGSADTIEVSVNRTQTEEVPNQWENASFLSRPKLVAWMVSHCDTVSGRELYINELIRYIPVDIYGRCGSLKCGKNHMDTYCYKDVLRPTYKFYLSFENSWCKDYITEKVFIPMNYGLVPVVYGGANFSDFLPPHSYIDATRMTPKMLARKLTRIAASDSEYASYHLWRNFWRIIYPVPFCDLCQRLHNDVTEAHIPDLGRWWGEVNNCSTRYPESLYPRPKPINLSTLLQGFGEGVKNVGSIFMNFFHN